MHRSLIATIATMAVVVEGTAVVTHRAFAFKDLRDIIYKRAALSTPIHIMDRMVTGPVIGRIQPLKFHHPELVVAALDNHHNLHLYLVEDDVLHACLWDESSLLSPSVRSKAFVKLRTWHVERYNTTLRAHLVKGDDIVPWISRGGVVV